MRKFCFEARLFLFLSDLCCPFPVLLSVCVPTGLVRICGVAAQVPLSVPGFALAPADLRRPGWRNRGGSMRRLEWRFVRSPFALQRDADGDHVERLRGSHVEFGQS